MSVELITAFKDICLSVAAIVTASVAIWGLKSWKKELSGKADFDVARGLIRATYKLRDEISYGRNPFTSAHEFPEGYDPLNKTPENQSEAWAYVFTNRWKPIAESVQEFDAQTLEAEALWGNDIKNMAFELRRCTSTLRVAMEEVVSNEASVNSHFESDEEFRKKIRSEVWAGWGGDNGNDELGERIDNSIKQINNDATVLNQQIGNFLKQKKTIRNTIF